MREDCVSGVYGGSGVAYCHASDPKWPLKEGPGQRFRPFLCRALGHVGGGMVGGLSLTPF